MEQTKTLRDRITERIIETLLHSEHYAQHLNGADASYLHSRIVYAIERSSDTILWHLLLRLEHGARIVPIQSENNGKQLAVKSGLYFGVMCEDGSINT